jgi:multimeric flavodoxin WrbA
MNAICDDLNMNYVGGFSADMYDLLKEEERQRVILFAEGFFEAIENKIPTSKSYQPLIYKKFDYIPGNGENKTNAGDKKIIVLTDLENNQTNLGRMIEKFKMCFANDIEVINLQDIDIKGGCLGCLQCGFENICAYGDKDEFIDFYNTKIKDSDVLVFAGAIKDRYLSSRWKLFFDRGFFYCHSPSLMGKQIGFIISGPLSQIPNLREILEAWTEWQQCNLVDFITDEYEDSAEIDILLHSFASRFVQLADKNYTRPRTFLGVGGMKVFRDDIWGRLRFPFVADHRFYKQHGIYDFPQKNFRTRIQIGILMFLTKITNIRREIYTKRMKDEVIKPLRKILEDIK